MKEGILTFFYIVGSLSAAAFFKIPLTIGFMVAFLLIINLANRKGMTLSEISSASLIGIKKIKPVFYILALISMLIPTWMISGTIQTMVAYLTEWINPEWIVLVAFLISAISSFILGTAIGTLGSLGIIILGVATAAGAPVPLVAGALISGAFFGDKSSPLSSILQLTSTMIEAKERDVLSKMIPSSLLLLTFSILFYLVLGLQIETKEVANASQIVMLIKSNYNVTSITLLPILILFGSILRKVPTVRALSYGVISGIIVAIITQDVPLLKIGNDLIFGYSLVPRGLEEVLHGGGVLSMVQLFIFISIAGMLNGLLDKSQMFQPIIDKLFMKGTSLTGYTVRTVFLSTIMAIIGGNQAFPVMITGQSVLPIWKKADFSEADLGRVISDSAIVISGLVPWNMVAILSSAAIGVSTLDYAKYAALLWIAPLTTILISWIYSFKIK